MNQETIEKIQRPLFFSGLGALAVGFGAKISLATARDKNLIDLGFFLEHLEEVSLIVWVYWFAVAIFFLTFIALAILEYIKRR
jgi:hypothetical protein